MSAALADLFLEALPDLTDGERGMPKKDAGRGPSVSSQKHAQQCPHKGSVNSQSTSSMSNTAPVRR